MADTRVALVIGNGEYSDEARLSNPVNDARDVASALQRIGFDKVLTGYNLGRTEMEGQVRAFAAQARDADVAVLFFAGHGMEVAGESHLLPVDATLQDDLDLDYETVPLSKMLRASGGARRLRLVILDACRDYPPARRMRSAGNTRSTKRGLARVEPDQGTMVAYAARDGTTAADGSGRNSPYTKALLTHLEDPGVDVGLMLRRVRDSVIEATDGRQEPFVYGSLPGPELSLVPGSSSKAPTPAQTTAPVAVEEMDEIWYALKRSNVRARPGTRHPIIGGLTPGQEVEVTGKVAGQDWLRVALADGKPGYVYAPLLSAAGPPSATSEPPGAPGPSAPAPALQNANGNQAEPEPSKAQSWGAVAVNEILLDSDELYFVWNQQNEAAAEKQALANCMIRNDEEECQLVRTFSSCLAVARSLNNWDLAIESDVESARSASIARCEGDAWLKSCELKFSVCADGAGYSNVKGGGSGADGHADNGINVLADTYPDGGR